jgi:hypothetical protein
MKNPTLYHPGQPQMQAQVILASSTALGPPIYTVRGRMPRMIWPEALTHRKFGRNARSSRAVPIKTMIEEISTVPFVPWHWGKNQKGMQADEECNTLLSNLPWQGGDDDQWTREESWIHASKIMIGVAEAYDVAGYHKQVVNRLLEPFMWIDVIITSTDWANFEWLRDHSDAEPHLQDWARLCMEAIRTCEVTELSPDEWHLPYITGEDTDAAYMEFGETIEGEHLGWEWLRQLSANRCARISYKPFDGDASYEREMQRYESLISSDHIHASPMEHQATPDKWVEPHNPYEGKAHWLSPHLHGNLDGWIQYRKLIPGEYVARTSVQPF